MHRFRDSVAKRRYPVDKVLSTLHVLHKYIYIMHENRMQWFGETYDTQECS